MKLDLNTWLTFLNHPSVFSRKFIDFTPRLATDISFYTDASKTIGFGGYCGSDWTCAKWNADFIKMQDPSISYLELYAVTVGIISWAHRFRDMCIVLFCDNQGAVDMINNASSKCKQCMKLIRIITLYSLIHNVKIIARHVIGINNELADFLSRDKMDSFWSLAKSRNLEFNEFLTLLPADLWPIEKLWFDDKD